jgi:hypothetical protein
MCGEKLSEVSSSLLLVLLKKKKECRAAKGPFGTASRAASQLQ